jgi:hypothetical protein
MKKQNKAALGFVVFFSFTIVSVGLWQSAAELLLDSSSSTQEVSVLEEKNWQVAEALVDFFKTPAERQHDLDSLWRRAEEQHLRVDSLLQNDGGVSVAEKDELLVRSEDYLRRFMRINRYVDYDSSAVDSLWYSWLNRLRLFKKTAHAAAAEEWTMVQIMRVFAEVENEHRNLFSAYIEDALVHVLFSQEYWRAYEKTLEDKSVVAAGVRKQVQAVRWSLWQDGGLKVVSGREALVSFNDWLFYRPGVQYLTRPAVWDERARKVDANDVAVVDDPVEEIISFKQELARKGVELLVVVVPTKANLYPEKLVGNLSSEESDAITTHLGYGREFLERLEKQGVATVNLYEAFRAEKDLAQKEIKKGAEASDAELLYLRQDTHWRLRALKRAAQEVAQKVRTMPWYKESLEDSLLIEQKAKRMRYSHFVLQDTLVERLGDVSVMTQLSEDAVGHEDMQPELVAAQRVWQVWEDSIGQEIRRQPMRNEFRKSDILIIGDSFSRIYQSDSPRSAGWVAHLAYELQEPLGAVISDGGASTLVREKLARRSGVLKNKKLLIWEFVERDIRYGEKGWQHITLPQK